MDTVDLNPILHEAGLDLVEKPEGLTLTDGTLELSVDLTHMLPRLRQGRLQAELLVKAARCRGVEAPVAIDATAGFWRPRDSPSSCMSATR